jgi:hypothetical protein
MRSIFYNVPPNSIMSVLNKSIVMLGNNDTTLVSYQRELEPMNSELATIFDMALLNL